jgi:ATP-dependent DNA helicase RecG
MALERKSPFGAFAVSARGPAAAPASARGVPPAAAPTPPRAAAAGIGALSPRPGAAPAPSAVAPRAYGEIRRPATVSPASAPARPGTAVAARPQAAPARPAAPARAAAPAASKPARKKAAPKPKGDLVARALKRLRMESPALSLLCVPQGYVDLRQIHTELPAELDVGAMSEARLYRLRMIGRRGLDERRQEVDLEQVGNWRFIKRLELELIDTRGRSVYFSIFGNVWAYRDAVNGDVMHLVGRLEYRGDRRMLMDVERPPAHATGKVWARYGGIVGQVSAETIETMVRGQLDNPDAFRACAALLTGEVGERPEVALGLAGAAQDFTTFEQLLRALHAPQTPEQGRAALRAARKLTAMGLQAAALRQNRRPAHPRSPLPVDVSDVDAIVATQPETMTPEQLGVMAGVVRRLGDPTPLNALLSGDVGTGKTLVYLVPAVIANRAGARVAIIAPTGILANQIAEQLLGRFQGLVSGVERVETGKAIVDPSAILVGTSGLLSLAAKSGYTPNVLIVDEQHKLSTTVKEELVKAWTHVIEVTATPVPRSLAAVQFGGKDVFNLRGCPVTKTFRNHIADQADRMTFLRMMRDVVAEGGRAAIVYPRVEASEEAALATAAASAGAQAPVVVDSVIEAARSLETAFPGKVIAVHGGMKEAEITRAIAMVKSGERPILVASTVIEAGIDIPSMKLMIVRDADRFGIAQLAQLRGRLVRNGGVGDFVMMVKEMAGLDGDTFARLEAVRTETDGYKLADLDLQIRGFGTLDGEAQTGESPGVFRLLKLAPKDYIRDRLRDADEVGEPQQASGQAEVDEGNEPLEASPASRLVQGRLFG